MKVIVRRLQRLEERYLPAIESEQTRYLRARLDAARLRCGLRPSSPERQAELKGTSIVAILDSGRQRTWCEREDGKSAPELN